MGRRVAQTKHLQVLSAALLGIASLGHAPPSDAQTMYRCGSTFSQTPCGTDAKEVRAAGVGQPVIVPPVPPIDEARRATLARICTEVIKTIPAWKDRDSLRITPPTRSEVGVVREVGGRRIPVIPWDSQVNGRNSFGGYTGDKAATCYFDMAETKVVDLFVMPDRSR